MGTKQTLMNKNEHYLWNISDKQQINKMKDAKYGYCTFSNNFGGNNNDNWTIKYYPEGMKGNDFRGAIFLRLLRKPIKIKTLKVRYSIELNENVIIEEVKEFSDEYHSNGYWIKKLSMTPDINKCSLQFNVKIDILEIRNYDDQVIQNTEWNKYGVTRLKPFNLI